MRTYKNPRRWEEHLTKDFVWFQYDRNSNEWFIECQGEYWCVCRSFGELAQAIRHLRPVIDIYKRAPLLQYYTTT